MSISVSDLISVCGINLFVSREEIILKYRKDFKKRDISPPKLISPLTKEEKKRIPMMEINLKVFIYQN